MIFFPFTFILTVENRLTRQLKTIQIRKEDERRKKLLCNMKIVIFTIPKETYAKTLLFSLHCTYVQPANSAIKEDHKTVPGTPGSPRSSICRKP